MKFNILALMIFSVAPSAFGATSSQTWKGAICSALMGGTHQADVDVTGYERAVAEFRTSLKPFAPDIRQDTQIDFKAGEFEQKKSELSIYIVNDQPGSEPITHQSDSEPSGEDRLAMARRAYALESDFKKSQEDVFRYGLVLEGRDKIIAHLENVERALDAEERQIEAYLKSDLAPWRKGNLFAVGVSAAAIYGVLGPISILSLLYVPVPYVLLASEFNYYRQKVTGKRRRTHVAGYREHLHFMRAQLTATQVRPTVRAYYGRNISMSPQLASTLKLVDADWVAIQEGVRAQTKLDRTAWFEQIFSNAKKGMLTVVFPRGPFSYGAVDEMLFTNPDTGLLTYVLTTRIFKGLPTYPSKPRESIEYFRQLQAAGG